MFVYGHDGAGPDFLLNNEMTDFDFVPVTPGRFDPNLAAGQASSSSMSPTIVLHNGAFDFAVGSPGGLRSSRPSCRSC